MATMIEKTCFMLRKLVKDLTRDRQIYDLAEDLHGSRLNDYYFLMTEEQLRRGHSQDFHFDDAGIPLIPTYIDVVEHRLIPYPIAIGQYGLAIWHTYLRTHSPADRERFLVIAEWFRQNRRDDETLGAFWLTDVAKPAYQITAPWKSAFAQARAMNILLRAHQLTGDVMYADIARRALIPFLYTTGEGGVAVNLDAGPFYEEYPANVPVLVLNGMIFALCGIYDLLRVHPGDAVARNIFDAGIQTLTRLLPRYDMGYWSRYSLCEAPFHPVVDPATLGYHHLHIVQLTLLFHLTQQAIFHDMATRWKHYVTAPNVLRMYGVKFRALRAMERL